MEHTSSKPGDPHLKLDSQNLHQTLHAEVFCPHFGNKNLSEIDYQTIEEFKLKRMKSITRYGRLRKPATVNRELAILFGIFRMAVDYGDDPQPV